MVISKEDNILIKNLWKSKGYSARRFIKEFPDKNWNRMGLDYALKKLRQTGTVEWKVGSGRRVVLCWVCVSVWVKNFRVTNLKFLTHNLGVLNNVDEANKASCVTKCYNINKRYAKVALANWSCIKRWE